MGFREEIIKARRKVLPYIRFSQHLNSGAWAGPEERLYSAADVGTYTLPMKGHVLQFGTFSRSVANGLFSLEIPGTSSTLMDPDLDWRLYAVEPFDTLLSKWIHYLLRVHDNSDDIYDATVALGQIQSISYPSGRKIALSTSVMAPEVLGDKIPRRTITLDDWPKAPPESVGRPVPIIYGRISNAVDLLEDEEENVGRLCDCPEYVPEPYTTGVDNQHTPGIRWCDNFSHGSEGEVDIPEGNYTEVPVASGVNGPAWIVRHYHGISFNNPAGMDLEIIEDTPSGGGIRCKPGRDYAEITRGIGPQVWAAPWGMGQEIPTGEAREVFRYGEAVGQYGACGMVRNWDDSFTWGLMGVMEVWGRAIASGALATVMSFQPWDLTTEHYAADAMIYANAHIGRANGATYEGGGFWSTTKLRNCLVAGQWQCLEMEWKISTLIDPHQTLNQDFGFNGEPAVVAHDGWLRVYIDGEVMMDLQEMQFYIQRIDEDDSFGGGTWTYWEGVAFRPSGSAATVYLSDRSLCRYAREEEVAVADPCRNTVSSKNAGGAIDCPMVDAAEIVSLTRATGIAAAEQDNTDQVTGVVGYVGSGGNIPAGTLTFYRVTAVKAGTEYSWSELVILDHSEPSYDRLEWDEWSGGADTYRIYQIASPDLNLHEDMGGTLRQETYWVKQVPALQTPGGRDSSFGSSPRWVEFGALGDGAPQQAMAEETTTETTFLVAGHTCEEITDVYAIVPESTQMELLGGLNHLTGEKDPIDFAEREPRMTRLEEGQDYRVEVVEKPSGRFTVVVVTREIRSPDNCSFSPVTVNVSGITYNADGGGDLITSGAHITRHFLLNWVFNHYTTGEWFNDVASAPGLIDKDSFDTAKAYSESRLSGGYVGAVALINPVDARQLILEAITTFNLNFFYKNAIDNNAGAWSVKMFDTRQFDPEAVSMEEFTPNDDIIAESLQTVISLELLVNVLHYMAGPNLVSGQQDGWMVTGTLQDYDSQARSWGRIERELLLPWTRDQATAVDVAAAHLDLRNYPFTMGQFQVLGRGVLVQPADTIKVTHPDAPGTGWTERVVFVLGHDLDMDSGITTLRFMTTPSMVT